MDANRVTAAVLAVVFVSAGAAAISFPKAEAPLAASPEGGGETEVKKGGDPPAAGEEWVGPPKPGFAFGSPATSGGRAEGFSWKPLNPPADPAAALDGEVLTAWTSSGPGAWTVTLKEVTTLSVLIIIWEGDVPAEATVEISPGGGVWEGVAGRNPNPNSATPLAPELLSFAPTPVSGIRISVPKTPIGGGFGIREVVAYAARQDIPAELLAAAAPEGEGGKGAGEVLETGAAVNLGPDGKVVARKRLSEGQRVGQILPRASGGAFLSLFAARGEGEGEGELGFVLQLLPDGEGSFEEILFHGPISPQSRIAWDGEWLFTLEGGQLGKVRRALGQGPADERGREVRVFSLRSEGEGLDPHLGDFRLTDRGWLEVEVNFATAGWIFDGAGERVRVSPRGVLRFRRDGGGLSFSPLTLAGDSPPQVEGGAAPLLQEGDGDQVWRVERSGEETDLVCLLSEVTSDLRPTWDDVPAEALPALLESTIPSVRREGAMEILRRKRDAVPDITRMLEESHSGETFAALLAVVSGLERGESLASLARLASSGSPLLRREAFLALGDHEDGRDHPAFCALGETTDPDLSAAIFEALLRSQSELPGAEDVAFPLSSHADADLARSARNFLIVRESVPTVFRRLDDPGKRGEWKAALALLVAFRSPEGVEGLIERLRSTREAGFRREGLKALCRLYFEDPVAQSLWEPSSRIAAFLDEMMRDPRVDRTTLLRDMEESGLPLPGGAVLAGLARADPSLEPFVLQVLATSAAELPEESWAWLKVVSADKNRDEESRGLAAKILSRSQPAPSKR